ncbi:formate dehydrogenase-like protein [Elsinoe australis]|uniref:Formate dehydrogenase-like protein n=1 Tax=Elsinoe australis TaxID=40998 RepID=A0A4U7B311_9PEZI|nr:formate dehydrogenase-like protein [Elsinoe australis]
MGGGPAKDVVLIALPFPEPKDYLSLLRSHHPGLSITYHQTSSSSPSLPASAYADVTILVTFATLPSHPSDAPVLELVQLFSAGSNHIAETPIYKDSDVTIATSSGIHGPQIAEWVVMTSLVHSHKYKALYELQKRHEWGKTGQGDDYHDVRDMVGRRIGVLGYGSIGRQVGRVGKAMGMEVVAFTASKKETRESKKDRGFIVPGTGDPEGEIPREWYSGLDKESLKGFLGRDLDVLLVSVPLTDDTRGMLGKEEFEVLSGGGKRKPFVVNIARGPIIKQDELIEALKDGTLGGAALDVTDPEPLPKDSELWDLKNAIVTPHVSGVGQAYTERAFLLLDEQLRRRSKGEKLLNVVQRKRGY